MGRQSLNTITPDVKQVWEHVTKQVQVLIINVDKSKEEALCAVMNGGKVSGLRVRIPLKKFMFWGNRGFAHVRNRAGKLPKPGKTSGMFNTRAANLGAL